jgi:hypothetical protein
MALAAVIWHYWIGVVLTLATLGMLAAIVAGYFAVVVRPKYPPKR